MKKASIIASSVLIIFSIYVLIESAKFETSEAAITLGPGFYPSLLAGAMIILNLLIIYNMLRSKADNKITFINKRVFIGLILIVGFAVIFKFLGFVLSSIIMMLFLCRVMGASNWKVIGVCSVIIPIGIYLVFNNLLMVPLPWGVFENFL